MRNMDADPSDPFPNAPPASSEGHTRQPEPPHRNNAGGSSPPKTFWTSPPPWWEYVLFVVPILVLVWFFIGVSSRTQGPHQAQQFEVLAAVLCMPCVVVGAIYSSWFFLILARLIHPGKTSIKD